MTSPARYVMAIDQGTTSSRAILFDHDGTVVSVAHREHDQSFPRAGWVEHDATEIRDNVMAVVADAMSEAEAGPGDVAAIGITNQRETTVVWDKATGEPVAPAIVWQDTRTQQICDRLAAEADTDDPAEGVNRYRERTGLPLSTYFAGPHVMWVLENVEGARERAEAGELLMGTIDTWLVWHLTGGVDGGLHVTDVTNASRTLLMNIDTLDWNPDICADMGIPTDMLPRIHSSSEVYGEAAADTGLEGVPIAGILGDQHAATFGQACLEPGQVKNTYGTGCFLLMNTGTEPVASNHGLLTTVAYKIGEEPAAYALEGSIAVSGSLVQWLRDNLGIISDSSEVEELAAGVDDNGGAYIVPAFSGLYAPYWRPDARGALVGLTRYVNKHHLARAVLEATAYQTLDVVEAMNADAADAGTEQVAELRVDGGMVANDLLMQFQADILDTEVIAPAVTETTALGAAYAAGIAVGFWEGPQDVADNWTEGKRWSPDMAEEKRHDLCHHWHKAVARTLDWVEDAALAPPTEVEPGPDAG